MTTAAAAPAAPPDKRPKWPKQVEEAYEPVRPLGKGAFGLVWLAKRKTSSVSHGDAQVDQTYVAIKHIKMVSAEDRVYAEREISILSELRHPNVIGLVHAYDAVSPQSKSRLIVMELADGPDIGTLISSGGALSLPLALLVGRHLIAAVSYLHGRGIIHRDLKPDNCILVKKGTSPETASRDDVYNDDSIWNDDGSDNTMEEKWKLILVDFGFARALTPADIGAQGGQRKTLQSSIFNESTRTHLEKVEEEDENATQTDSVPKRSYKQRASIIGRDRRGSVAKQLVRDMSAIGTRAFAAPEIKNRAREKTPADKDGTSECIADYGMVADAYSVGCTLKMAITGVPADVANAAEYISSQNNPLLHILSSIFSCGKKDTNKRRRQFRYMSAVPKHASQLIKDLTKAKPDDRLTVREAQINPWIQGADDASRYMMPQGDLPSRHGDPVVFLKCATK